MAELEIDSNDVRITLIGAGTIGLSLAALHLSYLPSASQLTIMSPGPDLHSRVKTYLAKTLPAHQHDSIPLINLTDDLPSAVRNATIIQENGPESLPFKTSLWATVEAHAPPTALLWSSTSGIPASKQAVEMQDKTRLLVVHPFNPPHVLPLLELVPSPQTSEAVVQRTLQFWRARGREPVLLRKEVPGFVAGRLAWAMLREAINLVDMGVVTVEELDRTIENSMGVRWAYAGPFKSFHAGGGAKGLEGLFANVGGTIQACWDDAGKLNLGDGWEGKVFSQVKETYGPADQDERDRANTRVLEVVKEEKERSRKDKGERKAFVTGCLASVQNVANSPFKF